MNIITLAHKRDMTYDFYLKHHMSAVELKLNAIINKDKTLSSKFPRNWRYPINTGFDCYRNNIILMNFVEEFVFYKPNLKDIDEIIGKSSFECSYRYIHSYKPLDLKNSVKILDMEKNKTKNK